VAVTLSGIIVHVPVVLLGHLRTPEEAGFYQLATSLTTIGSYLESSLGRVTYPIISVYWHQGEEETLRKSLKYWTLWVGVPVGSLMALTIPILPSVIPMVFGTHYDPILLGTQMLLGGASFSAVFFWLNPFYYASGKVHLWTMGFALYSVIVRGSS
jgi:O-antigen/teichoic acid export membrane protein